MRETMISLPRNFTSLAFDMAYFSLLRRIVACTGPDLSGAGYTEPCSEAGRIVRSRVFSVGQCTRETLDSLSWVPVRPDLATGTATR